MCIFSFYGFNITPVIDSVVRHKSSIGSFIGVSYNDRPQYNHCMYNAWSHKLLGNRLFYYFFSKFLYLFIMKLIKHLLGSIITVSMNRLNQNHVRFSSEIENNTGNQIDNIK